MNSTPNRLFKGWCSNEGNPQSHILHYEIITVRKLSDDRMDYYVEEVKTLEEYYNMDGMAIDDPFYSVVATFKLNVPRGSLKLFESDDLKSAIFIVQELSGNKVVENDIN